MGGCFRRFRLFGLEIVLVLGFMAAVNTDMHWNDKWNLNLVTRSPQAPYFVKSWDLAMLFLSWTWSNHRNDRCLFLWKGRKVAGQQQSVFSWTTPMSYAAVIALPCDPHVPAWCGEKIICEEISVHFLVWHLTSRKSAKYLSFSIFPAFKLVFII